MVVTVTAATAVMVEGTGGAKAAEVAGLQVADTLVLHRYLLSS